MFSACFVQDPFHLLRHLPVDSWCRIVAVAVVVVLACRFTFTFYVLIHQIITLKEICTAFMKFY